MHALALALALALAALLPLATADLPPTQPTITTFSHSGSGCPQTTTVERTGAGWADMGFVFPAAFTAVAPGTKRTLNCQVLVQAAGASPGWQVALAEHANSGHARLQPGGVASFLTTTFFSGEDSGPIYTIQGAVNNTGDGVLDTDSTTVSVVPEEKLVWSKCTTEGGDVGFFNVNFRVALSAQDNSFAASSEQLSFVWRQC